MMPMMAVVAVMAVMAVMATTRFRLARQIILAHQLHLIHWYRLRSRGVKCQGSPGHCQQRKNSQNQLFEHISPVNGRNLKAAQNCRPWDAAKKTYL
jgi:hypothetical protein